MSDRTLHRQETPLEALATRAGAALTLAAAAALRWPLKALVRRGRGLLVLHLAGVDVDRVRTGRPGTFSGLV